MTQQPPHQPLEYVSPIDEPVPACIQVISIIGIVLGGLTLLFRLFSVAAGIVMTTIARNGHTPVGYSALTIASALLFAGFAVWLIVASIGCLKHLEWARQMLVAYAVAYGIATILEIGISLLTVVPGMHQFMVNVNGNATRNNLPPNFFVVFVVGGALIGGIIVMILPTFIWIYMRKPEVRRVFTSPS